MVPTSGSYYGYRGDVYPAVAVAKEWVGLPLDGDVDRFPDAIEVHDRPGNEPWAKVPRGALDGAFTRHVHARWHGVPVAVGAVVRNGPTRGLIARAQSEGATYFDMGYNWDTIQDWYGPTNKEMFQLSTSRFSTRPSSRARRCVSPTIPNCPRTPAARFATSGTTWTQRDTT